MSDLIVRQFLVAQDRMFADPIDLEFGRTLGDARFRLCKERRCRARVLQDLIRTRSNMRAGAINEVIVARRLNLYPDLTFTGYPDHNLRLHSGELIAVQHDAQGRCILDQAREAAHRERGDPPPDFRIILAGAWPHHLEFAGWVTHAEALAGEKTDLGYGPCWVRTTLRERLEIITPARGLGYRGAPPVYGRLVDPPDTRTDPPPPEATA